MKISHPMVYMNINDSVLCPLVDLKTAVEKFVYR